MRPDAVPDDSIVASLVEVASGAVAVLDPYGHVLFANATVAQMCDVTDGDFHGADLAQLVGLADHDRLAAAIAAVRSGADPQLVVCDIAGPVGEDEPRRVEITLQGRPAGKQVTGILATFEDVTARRAMDADLRRLSTEDPLTGLLNRAAVLEEIRVRLDHEPTKVAVLYCDIDAFRAVNDRYGHSAGDELLASVAEILRAATRDTDIVGRLRGDEFVIVVDSNDELSIDRLVRRIGRDLLVAPTPPVSAVSVSVGVAFGRPGDDAALVLERADRSMRETKRSHRLASTPRR